MHPLYNDFAEEAEEEMDFTPHTNKDREQLLSALGISSLDELFSDIPDELRDRFQPLEQEPLSEIELTRHIQHLAEQNGDPQSRSVFLGAGVYNHYIPAVVNHVTSRSEFYTAYTPYQAEISQGTLTWMFEFQTAISELYGMDIANSSLYDGASAAAEACLMARDITGKDSVLLAEHFNPIHREVIETYFADSDQQLISAPCSKGKLIRENLQELCDNYDPAAVVVQSPTFLGNLEDLSGLKQAIEPALLIVSTNPISTGLFTPPGEFGADIVVGEGQPLGNPPYHGGPLLGLFATKKEYLRYLPGRISGKTEDDQENEGFVMALQTREQHIKRARATSNICTNQALNALAALIFLSYLGPDGLTKLAELNWDKSHYLADQLTSINGVNLVHSTPFFNEFTIEIPNDNPEWVWTQLQQEGFDLLHPEYLKNKGLHHHLLVACTEMNTKSQMDRLVSTTSEVLR